MVSRKKNRKRECIDFATRPGFCLQFILGVVFGHLPRGQSFQYIRQGLGHIYNFSRDPLLGANSVVSGVPWENGAARVGGGEGCPALALLPVSPVFMDPKEVL